MAADPQMTMYEWEIGWQYDASCRGEDSELFFAPNYFERKALIRERDRAARRAG